MGRVCDGKVESGAEVVPVAGVGGYLSRNRVDRGGASEGNLSVVNQSHSL